MDLVARAQSIVRAQSEAVFQAFVDPKKMSQYWFHRNDDGMKAGESVMFYLGDGESAFGFEAKVLELTPNSSIHIRWGDENGWTDVKWTLEETETGDTKLTIEETGFTGSDADVIARALDSTGGFNQVIIAAKAFIEHGAAINVVTDHA